MRIFKYILLLFMLIPAISLGSIITNPQAYVHGDSVTGVIESTDTIHLAIGSSNVKAINLDFQAGEAGSITAIADGGGGEITITAAGHGLAAGEIVSLVGGTGYDDLYEVQSVNGNDFNVTATFSATGTGTYIRGLNYTVPTGSAGGYRFSGGFTGNNSTGGAVFYFYVVVNTTEYLAFARTFSNSTDVGNTGTASRYLDINEGDIISFGFKNITGTSDIEQIVLDIEVRRELR